ncbi:MAG TPA: NAD-dependent epimerase/dehydratase family protein [Stellaceae bacterium]|jgi:nucleoside-diphosphate-sugar epimerase|nr:NAD-dependent epimerase/dehydratase family protein [Stellaceae bacterium]
MNIFLTGATGYIGGTVAARLLAAGHHVTGLVRSAAGDAALREQGIVPLRGELADRALLADAARRADAVINAANSDNRDIIEAVLPELRGSGKAFIQTSGSSIVGDKAGGELGTRIYDEDTPVVPLPEKAPRVAINNTVLAAANDGVRAIVLCPSLIYGSGAGLDKDSVQVPRLITLAKESGVARHVGAGENIWSHVHIDDVAALFLLALDKAAAGSFFYAENGEASMKSVAQAISRMLGMDGRTEAWPLDEAIKAWGRESAEFTFASNSRVRAVKARRALDWSPEGPPLLLDIEHGSYRRAHAA